MRFSRSHKKVGRKVAEPAGGTASDELPHRSDKRRALTECSAMVRATISKLLGWDTSWDADSKGEAQSGNAPHSSSSLASDERCRSGGTPPTASTQAPAHNDTQDWFRVFAQLLPHQASDEESLPRKRSESDAFLEEKRKRRWQRRALFATLGAAVPLSQSALPAPKPSSLPRSLLEQCVGAGSMSRPDLRREIPRPPPHTETDTSWAQVRKKSKLHTGVDRADRKPCPGESWGCLRRR
jgi:hypothetical protein